MDHISLDIDLDDPSTHARLASGDDLLVTIYVRDRRGGVRRQAMAHLKARLAPGIGAILTLEIPRLSSLVSVERNVVPWKEMPDFSGNS